MGSERAAESRAARLRNWTVLGSPFAFVTHVERIDQREDDMAKKTQQRGAKRARRAGKRDLVRRPKASTYAKRTARGRFNEMDDVARSQKADKPRKAKKKVRSGYGDQGDKRRSVRGRR